MAIDKLNREINRKLDLIMEKLGIKDEGAPVPTRREPRELTEAEKQAIANAPSTTATMPTAERGPRVTAQNAPDTSSSTPRKGSDSKKK